MDKFIERKQVEEYIKAKFGLQIDQVEKFATSAKITMTEERIKEYLTELGRANGVDMDGKRKFSSIVILPISDEEIEARSQDMMEEFMRSRYRYNGIDLKYYKDCFEIYTAKSLKFCEIVRMMQDVIPVDQELMEKLDIQIEGDKIRESDVDRVAKPLEVCFKKAKETRRKANNVKTYEKCALNEHAMHMDGVTYGECLPTKQLIDRGFFYSETCIHETEKQKEERREAEIKSMEYWFSLTD